MNDTNITEPSEPVEEHAADPAKTDTPQQETSIEVVEAEGSFVLPTPPLSEEPLPGESEESARLLSPPVADEVVSETEEEATLIAPVAEAPLSVALPEMMEGESVLADTPIVDVPSGSTPTDESPSEDESITEGLTAEATPAEVVEVEPSPLSVATPPTTAPRPPVPPVFFVWHNQMNEEREDTEVLPSERWREAYHLLEVTGALHWREVKSHSPDLNLGRPEALTAYHTKAYCQAMTAVSEGRANLWAEGNDHYLPTLTQTVPAAGLNVAAVRSAIKVAMSHPKVRVFTPAGQQPHACRDHLEEGHLFNDVIMALADAQAAGIKTAFINLDAEHPRPIQERFYHDPLLTISLHEHPSFLYPHTGSVRETGKGGGAGYHVNIPMPPGVSDAGYQLVLEQLILPLLNRFQPQLLVVLGGITAHVNDPASHLRLTSKGYQAILTALMDAVPRFVLFGGDATHYATAARLWTIALATMADRTTSLPPQIPAAHARLWSGGTFHDADPLWRSAPYQEYTYGLLATELEHLHPLLRKQWDLPDLALPEQLSDQRERIQIRPSSDITSYTSKEPSRGMTFAGLNESLGDDDDDAVAQRKPRPSSRPATHSHWSEAKEEDEGSGERNKARSRRDEPPLTNPLGGSERRGASEPRPPRDGGRTMKEGERPEKEREQRTHGAGRGAPESRRGFPKSDERRGTKEEAAPPQARGQGQRRQDADNRRRSESPSEERRERKTGSNPRPPQGERQDASRSSRTPHSAVLPRPNATPDKNADEHSPAPPRSTPRAGERDERERSNQSFRRRERGGRGQGGQGESKPVAPPPSESTPESPDSRPARRHRPRSRR